jgi:hypothetical protein
MNASKLPRLITTSTMVVLIIIIIIVMITRTAHNQLYSGQLSLTIAPAGSQVVVDGTTASGTAIRVKPGKLTINVSKFGFSSQTKTTEITKGQMIAITIALSPNSTATANWYANNPADETILEQATGQNYNQQSSQAVQQVPLIQQLPYVDPSLAFRVDYGEPLAGSSVPGIYITAPTTQGQQVALQWIEDQGYNPSTLHIQYNTDAVNN